MYIIKYAHPCPYAPTHTPRHSHPVGKPQKEKQKTERKKSDRKKKKEKKQKKNSSFTKFVPHLVNSMCVREALRAGKWSLSAPSPSSHSQFQNKNFRAVKYFYFKKLTGKVNLEFKLYSTSQLKIKILGFEIFQFNKKNSVQV